MVSEIIAKLGTMQSDLGIVGMGVMGRSLAKNALNKGFKVFGVQPFRSQRSTHPPKFF